MAVQEANKNQTRDDGINNSKKQVGNDSPIVQQGIPENEIKQNSGLSASMALQAMQKAWDLRQAANAAGDPDAREEILAKAINKEIEAESFGKAAKYTRSGAFQGLAAGAGLGVQPGVTLGKLTGALVGGVVSTVTGLVGGGVGSVYGAINGPFWDLGEMASQGVRSIVGDFPNWKSSPAQKKALEKMVMQTRETQAPTKEELEEMKADAPDNIPQSWSQSAKDISNWRPSIPNKSALGLGGFTASMPTWGGQDKTQVQQQSSNQPKKVYQHQAHQPSRTLNQQIKPKSPQLAKKENQQSRQVPRPKTASTSNKATRDDPLSQKDSPSKERSKPEITPKSKEAAAIARTAPIKAASQPRAVRNPQAYDQSKQTLTSDTKAIKPPALKDGERRKPRKLNAQNSTSQPNPKSAPKKSPRKLETRGSTA